MLRGSKQAAERLLWTQLVSSPSSKEFLFCFPDLFLCISVSEGIASLLGFIVFISFSTFLVEKSQNTKKGETRFLLCFSCALVDYQMQGLNHFRKTGNSHEFR